MAAIFEDSEGDLWIGTGGGGLNKLDKANGEFKRYLNDPKDPNSISNDVVLSIAEDSPGILLIGTNDGLNKFEKATGKFERIKIYSEVKNKEGKNEKETVLRFIKDKSGVIWVSSYLEGLYKIYDQSQKFQSILPGENVTSVY